jgi:hypothetical protein
MLPAPVMW